MMDEERPAWAANFFVGMPAPAGAITVLLPIYVSFLGMPHFLFVAPLTLLYTLGIAFLMVSRLPVYSGKKFGKRVPPEMVLPIFVIVVLFFALLVSYPWEVLTLGTLAYLAALPFGWLSHRSHQRVAAAPDFVHADAVPTAPQPAAAGTDHVSDSQVDPERPARLN
jgi:CDP-diacylglycerol--serine O-phosphatidyltransferase